MNTAPREIIDWLETWSGFIHERNFEAAAQLFDIDVIGFGTVASEVRGRDALVAQQWQQVWPHTRGFAFDYDSLHVEDLASGYLLCVQWSGEGLDARTGDWFARKGRATIGLRKAQGGLLCFHTHFSLEPARECFL